MSSGDPFSSRAAESALFVDWVDCDVTGSVVGREQVSAGVVDGDVAGVGFEFCLACRLKGPRLCIDIEARHYVVVTKSDVGVFVVGRDGEGGGSTGS